MKPKNWAQLYLTPVRTLLAQAEGRSFEEIGYDETPTWLPKVQELIIKQVFGRVMDLDSKPKSYIVGFLISWTFVSLVDLRKKFKDLKKAFGENARPFNEEEKQDWENMWNEALPEPDREKAAKAVIKGAVKYTFSDHKSRWSFFDGLNEGRKTIYTEEGEYYQQGDRIHVLLFMWIIWPFHEDIRNRTQLRELLVKAFGEQRIGDQKQLNDFLDYNGVKGIGHRGRPKELPES